MGPEHKKIKCLCTKPGYDPTEGCRICKPGLDKNKDCAVCEFPGYDLAKECRTCKADLWGDKCDQVRAAADCLMTRSAAIIYSCSLGLTVCIFH